jgi:hypothetical protein
MIGKSTAKKILNLGGQYTTLPNKSIGLIKSSDTLGVWTYLVSKPRDWEINKKNVCQRLGISIQRYYKSMRELKEVDLCREYAVRHNRKGFMGKEIIIVSGLHDWEDVDNLIKNSEVNDSVKFTVLRTSQKQTLHKTDASESPIYINKRDIEITEKTKAAIVEENNEVEIEDKKFAAAVNVDFENKKNDLVETSTKAKRAESYISKPACRDVTSSKPKTSTKIIKDESDLIIADVLTTTQTLVVENCVDSLVEPGAIALVDGGDYKQAIAKTLLDKNQFKQTGNSFEYKLNAIKKAIREGYYTTKQTDTKQNSNHPQTLQEAEEQRKIQAIKQEINKAKQSIQAQESAIASPIAQMQGEQFIEVCKQKIKKYTDILQKLKQELASLLEGISGCNSKTLGAA